jgi:hypothetical protein
MHNISFGDVLASMLSKYAKQTQGWHILDSHLGSHPSLRKGNDP